MLSLTSPIRTPYHALRASTKLLALCVFTLAVTLSGDPRAVWGAAALVAGLYLAGGLRFAAAGLRMLRPLVFFVAIVALWHGILGEWAEGALVIGKLAAAFGLANLVTMTTRLDDMIALVERVAAPLARLGIEPRLPALSLALVMRFVPVQLQRAAALGEAWRARSRRRPGWRLVTPLALLAIDDAEHVSDALRARGGVRPPASSKG
ncbi:energy-coupling factor transporter transmembrane component T family protein [Profundibacterium mesophilum]|uniref:ABC transporter membrane spanning protein n=1 Tax=Profundibacterium mesophilum KAUST100406-0324 TaxID=1037889 RepID=A0A921NPD2_9RHOB|nr:energy-coupling factor transporter transmembrane component T [Profundibacterium mesophilum]KAF0675921.1 ABC transporter membrane spanning protein [Profundibacterium mesophilum KAUST100406-0324]